MHKLGQVFLKSNKIAAEFVKYANVNNKDIVLEIGPGKGIITRYLLRMAKKVYAIEIDKTLAIELDKRFPNLEIIVGDALKIKWPQANKLISNVPYYISSELVFKLAKEKQIKLAVLGFQKDFALRLVAKPGTKEYGRLTVAAQSFFDIEYLRDIPRYQFEPVPKVDGAIVRFKRKDEKIDVKFLDFLRKIFPYKNKLINNALKHAGYKKIDKYKDKKVKDLSKEELLEIFSIVEVA